MLLDHQRHCLWGWGHLSRRSHRQAFRGERDQEMMPAMTPLRLDSFRDAIRNDLSFLRPAQGLRVLDEHVTTQKLPPVALPHSAQLWFPCTGLPKRHSRG